MTNDDQISPGTVLAGRYELGERVGLGGMAAVYLARDRKHDREVAVKVLNRDLLSSSGSERFLREIRIAAQLAHPHILPLHDSGEWNGILYYVMPFVEGDTLRNRLDRERQLPIEDAVRIACEIAEGLEHAHRSGVLHRDIKPENILLQEGHAVIADFGIALALSAEGRERLTATGLMVGTPSYVSPEQVGGDPLLDGRSDVYSLGCVLYEMLAGEPPFTGPTAQAVIAKRLSGQTPSIRTLRPAVPVAMEGVLLRALSAVPADRFRSAAAFGAALKASTAPEASRQRRRPNRIAVAAGLTTLLAASAGLALFRLQEADATPATTIAVLPLANTSTDPEYAFLAEGLTDALIGDLVRDPALKVISRSSVMRFASSGMADVMDMTMDEPGAADLMPGGMGGMAMPALSIAQIAKELRADLIIQGNLALRGDSVRISLSLFRGDPTELVWAREFGRPLRDLFALQRDLAVAIAGAVVEGGPERTTSALNDRSYDPAAHEAFLKGAYYQTHWRLKQAVGSFQRAIELDPSHVGAYAGLARAYYFLGFFGDVAPAIALREMRRAANAALAQDSTFAEAYAQLALVLMIQDWDWEGAERLFRRALQISPNNPQIHHDYAHFLLGQGRQAESSEETRQALALDPANPMLTSCVGWHLLFAGDHDDAAHFATEAIDMMPDQWAQIILGWAQLGNGDGDSAVGAMREAVRLQPNGFSQAALAYALAATGRAAEARHELNDLLRRADDEYVSPYDIATVYAALGDADATFRWLRRAADERSMFVVHLGWDARFGSVRADARFAQLMDSDLRLPLQRFAAAYPARGLDRRRS